MTDTDPTNRFANRVEYYAKYRPGYPDEVIELLQDKYSLSADHEVADIGAGIGHSTRLFTDLGCYVYAIEPNQEMHDYLMKEMAQVPNFTTRLQAAENTDLEGDSIDFIVCGQSFHWFDARKSKTEFLRILKPEGVVVLLWNSWKEDTPFGKAYTELVAEHTIDYNKVSRTSDQNEDKIKYLYREGSYSKDSVEHSQYFDVEGLKGRYMSSSYALLPEMDGYDVAMAAIEQLFEQYQQDGEVEFAYTCNIYHGKLRS